MEQEKKPFTIVIPIYEGVDLMDVAAPREIFNWMGQKTDQYDVAIYCVAETCDLLHTRDGMFIGPDAVFTDDHVQCADLIWVPGGSVEALEAMLPQPDLPFFNYIKKVSEGATWITSVCEGALLLANTGLLKGHTVTTHWAFYPCMSKFKGVTLVSDYPRYVKSGNRVTGGGISSGVDEALYLVELICEKATAVEVQETIQYFPKPPVTGSITPATSCPVSTWFDEDAC